MPKRILPNFLIIGGMKCGTSSLHYYLSQHKDIKMSKEKDLHFFTLDEVYNRGIDWYSSLFDGYNNEKAIGETSASYSSFPFFKDVYSRIKDTLGTDIKIIYLVRDPIERILSHYTHDLAKSRVPEDFDAYCLSSMKDTYYVEYSKYGLQIEQYTKFLKSENILIISSESLRNRRLEVLKKIFDFLNVDADYYSTNFEKSIHESSEKKIYNRFGLFLAHVPLLWKYRNKFPWIGKPIEKIKPSTASKDILRSYMNEDILKFVEKYEIDRSDWKTFFSN